MNVKKLKTLLRRSPKIPIISQEAAAKFLENETFSRADMKTCIENILLLHHLQVDFEVVVDERTLDKFLSRIKTTTAFLAYDHGKGFWVLLCIQRKSDGNIDVWYKDPTGGSLEMVEGLEEAIRKHFPENRNIFSHRSRDLPVENLSDFGPVCLGNLDRMLSCIENETTDLSKVDFYTDTEVKNEKLDRMMKSYVPEFAANDHLKADLGEFFRKLPAADLKEVNDKYLEALKKGINENDLEKATARIQNARKDFLESKALSRFNENFPIEHQTGEAHECKLQIERKYPSEMRKLRMMWELIDSFDNDELLQEKVKKIFEDFQIDYEKLRIFFERRGDGKGNVDKLSVKTPDEIVKNLPSTQNYLPDEEQEVSNKGILRDIQNEDEKQNYELLLAKIEEYRQEFTEYDVGHVQNWAKERQGKLSQEDICTALAVANRAIFLTNQYHLRSTQLLAVLIFLHKEENVGKLCQILTGEGKTAIVAVLAAIKCLQGHSVDVITSSPVLALEGVDKMRYFYHTMGLTVENNNDNTDSAKEGYEANVLYGSINNFQFDFLRDILSDREMRCGRTFNVVILDEVDSMLVDNGGHVAKISSPFPGMESLRYIYIKIWEELMLLKKDSNLTPEALYQRLKPTIETCLRGAPFTKLIPNHLKMFVDGQIDIWTKNAIKADLELHEHCQYRLMDVNGERVVVPVDYSNTGVSMKNTIWCSGLHQFVQLKHNLQLTYESLTSCYISNIAYIKKYPDGNIFGLTGTLGSEAEQTLLKDIYNISFDKVPTYKQKAFEELDGLVFDDVLWHIEVSKIVAEKAHDGRAVLVICETEEQTKKLECPLNRLKNNRFNFNLKFYTSEEHSDVVREEVVPGDVILATNIAGRGTDFQTSRELEENGGLHVVVGFLPYNQRVEDQNYGRTSRQGNKGTAQLIVSERDIENVGTDTKNFEIIKEKRDWFERQRLEEIRQTRLKDLKFKDDLFELFSNFYSDVKGSTNDICLKDLSEFFSFWLYEIERSPVEGSARAAFENFKEKFAAVDFFNPFNCIEVARLLQNQFEREKAEKVLQKSLDLCGENPAMTYGIHIKKAEIIIDSTDTIRVRLKKAFKNLVFIDAQEDENYKELATGHLKKAKESLEHEINHLGTLIGIDTFQTNCSEGDDRSESIDPSQECSGDLSVESADVSVVASNDKPQNIFLKHLYARLSFLRFNLEHVKNLLKNYLEITDGVAVAGRIDPTEAKFYEENNINDVFKASALEIKNIGLDAIVCLQTVYDIPDSVLHTAQAHVAIGLASLSVGFFFPPAAFATTPIAITLIVDSVVDLVFELLSKGKKEFNKKMFWIGKTVTYSVSLLTMGLSYILQGGVIIEEAIRFCQNAAVFLKKSTYLPKICKILADSLRSIASVLEFVLTTIRVVGEIEVSHPAIFTIIENAWKPATSIATSSVCTYAYFNCSDAIFREIMKLVDENPILKQLLKNTFLYSILKCVNTFLDMKAESEMLTEKLGLILQSSDGQNASLLDESSECRDYAKKLCVFLEKNLVEGAASNSVEKVVQDISDAILSFLMKLAVKMSQSKVHTHQEQITNKST